MTVSISHQLQAPMIVVNYKARTPEVLTVLVEAVAVAVPFHVTQRRILMTMLHAALAAVATQSVLSIPTVSCIDLDLVSETTDFNSISLSYTS
jgi:hypothetical protein